MNRYRAPVKRGWLPKEPRLLAGENPLAYSKRIVEQKKQREKRRGHTE